MPMYAYAIGLRAFKLVVEAANPKDGALFSDIVSFGVKRFGIEQSELATRVGHHKGTISKWANGMVVPPQPTREVVLGWMLSRIEDQLSALPDPDRVTHHRATNLIPTQYHIS